MKEFKIKVNGNDYSVTVANFEGNLAQVEVNGTAYSVEVEGISAQAARPTIKPVVKPVAAPVARPAAASAPASSGGGAVQSPLPGIIVDINVKVGDVVTTGQKLLVLEAMKMENNINSDRDGKVIEIKVNKGDSVLEGADLVVIG